MQDSKCGACEKDRSSTMVQMYGQPYDPTSLKTVAPSEDATTNRVRNGKGRNTYCYRVSQSEERHKQKTKRVHQIHRVFFRHPIRKIS